MHLFNGRYIIITTKKQVIHSNTHYKLYTSYKFNLYK